MTGVGGCYMLRGVGRETEGTPRPIGVASKDAAWTPHPGSGGSPEVDEDTPPPDLPTPVKGMGGKGGAFPKPSPKAERIHIWI